MKGNSPEKSESQIFTCRGGSRSIAKFLSDSNTFHIRSKAIKMLSSKNFFTLLSMLLNNNYNKLKESEQKTALLSYVLVGF